jgi:hypothetical protein
LPAIVATPSLPCHGFCGRRRRKRQTIATLNHSVGEDCLQPDGGLIAASVPTGIRVWSSSGGDERWSWAAKRGPPVFSQAGDFS